jgi:hypothetical protein
LEICLGANKRRPQQLKCKKLDFRVDVLSGFASTSHAELIRIKDTATFPAESLPMQAV